MRRAGGRLSPRRQEGEEVCSSADPNRTGRVSPAAHGDANSPGGRSGGKSVEEIGNRKAHDLFRSGKGKKKKGPRQRKKNRRAVSSCAGGLGAVGVLKIVQYQGTI